MLKKKLNDNKCILGTWSEIPSTYSANIISKAQLDFLILDMEHGVFNYDVMQNIVFAAESENSSIIVRVPRIDESMILRALDIGAEGIIVPGVETVEEVDEIVQYSKYAPIGKRGYNPYIKAGGYGKPNDNYFEEQNDKVIIGIILETQKGIANLEEILKNPYVDIVYIGQYDLSIDLGVPGDVSNSKVVEIVEKCVETATRFNKVVGCMVHSIEEAVALIDKGTRFIVYKSDSGVLYSSYNSFVSGVKENETF